MSPLIRTIAHFAQPFDTVETTDLSPILDRIGDARIVLLGEATHGTSEFYRMRARISRELIERKKFDFVVIEGDWPDAAPIDHNDGPTTLTLGGAAATEMSARGEHNLGHLCRGVFGKSCYVVGFGTNSGTVAAASNWAGPMEVKPATARQSRAPAIPYTT
jgi:erythromycin esterase-like protein